MIRWLKICPSCQKKFQRGVARPNYGAFCSSPCKAASLMPEQKERRKEKDKQRKKNRTPEQIELHREQHRINENNRRRRNPEIRIKGRESTRRWRLKVKSQTAAEKIDHLINNK